MPRQLNSRSIADNAITGVHIAAGAVEQSDINNAVTLGAKGMVHGFITDSNTNLQWTDNVTAVRDSDGNDIYDDVIFGTDDMSFSIDSNGHLIMTIT